MSEQELFVRWLELDKAIAHDGEVTTAEREQWEIEDELDELGLYPGWNPSSQQTELMPAKCLFPRIYA